MNAQNESLQELQHIKKMMERSTKFSSVSGIGVIAAGVCALVGIWSVVQAIAKWKQNHTSNVYDDQDQLQTQLLVIAAITFIAAAVSSFIFISIRAKKLNVPVFGRSAMRVIINVMIPLFVGGLFVLRLASLQAYELIAPATLIFYGLALVNASKYTLDEIRYLGFAELLVGLLNVWIIGYGLIFWGIGFGLMHIIFGAIIWWKYEKKGIDE